MSTLLKVGPADHGRPMSLEEFTKAAWEEGYQYELIDGRLYVSPEAEFPHARLDIWLLFKLHAYAIEYPEVINVVYNKARVFIPDRPDVTNPEPDLAAYHNFPLDADASEIRWQELSPLLVAEIVSEDADKDLTRNVELYLQVPSIREYWILDSRNDPNRPTLLVYRRRGQRWQRAIAVEPGETYATKLLPEFALLLDSRR